MKAINATFWTCVAAIGVAFVMTVVTAVQQKQTEKSQTLEVIPVPAVAEPSR